MMNRVKRHQVSLNDDTKSRGWRYKATKYVALLCALFAVGGGGGCTTTGAFIYGATV